MDITIPNSVYIDGQWFAATWLAEIADQTTGELIITATVKQPTRVAALRLTNDMMSDLRIQAGFTGPTPVQRAASAAAELAYMRESVQFAADMLFRGHQRFLNWPHEAIDAEAYLRQLLTLGRDNTPDPSNPSAPSAPCYDCRTTGDRLASLEKMITSLHEHQVLDARRIGRLDIATGHADSMAEAQINALEQRLDAIEAGMASLKKVITSLHEVWMDKIEQRLDVLEAHAVETDDTLSILDGRVTNDAIAGVERLQALEKRWDFLSQQFLLVMQHVDAGLPGADYMYEQYDAEHDAAIISYWGMKLLAMIETVNARLGVAVGGA